LDGYLFSIKIFYRGYMRNQLILTGRLTKDPEPKTVNSELLVVCSMAYNKNKDSSWFIDFNAWGNMAEKLKPYKRGELVQIAGELDVQSWEKDGQKFTKPIVNIKFIQPVTYKQLEKSDTSTAKDDDRVF
jgi:single-stranded DNA-binding protein